MNFLASRSQSPVSSTLVALACASAVACSSGNGATPSTGDGGADSAFDAVSEATAVADSGATTDAGSPVDAPADADAATTVPSDGGPPPGFWDDSGIPAAKNVMMFKFLNRTNGKYADADVYWSFKSGSISELHSIADQPTYDMPANSSGRMYFYLCSAGDTVCAADPTKSQYFDFIEHTIGATQYNGNTTRVDAFGLKIAMDLHCADGFDVAVGESYQTFADDRATTFQQFLAAVPAEFQPLAQAPYAPYRIVNPGTVGFTTGGVYEHYYDSFVDTLWANNGITLAKPGANGSGLSSNPDLSAAIFRHVGDAAGTFAADGTLLDKSLWTNPTTFYQSAPANYYAQFWHEHALAGKAYGFPYDDVGGYSSYVSHANPQYLLVAIGW